MTRAWLAGVVVLAACRAPRLPYVAVRGSEVVTHLQELRTSGEAQLSTVTVSGKQQTPGYLETVFFYQTVVVDGATTSIEALAAGCVQGDEAGCALARHHDALIKLRELARPEGKRGKDSNVAAIAFGALALGSLAGGVYCLAECESKKGLKTMGLGLGTLIFGMVSYVLAGGTIRD